MDFVQACFPWWAMGRNPIMGGSGLAMVGVDLTARGGERYSTTSVPCMPFSLWLLPIGGALSQCIS